MTVQRSYIKTAPIFFQLVPVSFIISFDTLPYVASIPNMVQYRPTTAYATTLHGYWKLEDYDKAHSSRHELQSILRKRKFYVKSSTTKERLAKLLSRSDRGLLSYDAYTVSELRKFCTQRQIFLSGNENKQALVDMLEIEDEEAEFDKLVDLPAELRNHIYSLHFQDFPILGRPVPPPITEVSPQLRKETLQLFYQTCRVKVDLAAGVRHNSGLANLFAPKMVASNYTARLFLHAPEACISNMRSVRIEGIVIAGNMWIVTAWDVDLKTASEKLRIGSGRALDRAELLPVGYKEAKTKVEARLRTELEAIATRGDGEKFRREDLKRLRRIFLTAAEEAYSG